MAETKTVKPNVFTLDRIYDHNVVKIDGAEHALRNKDAIAILDFKWIEKNARRIDEIFNLERTHVRGR